MLRFAICLALACSFAAPSHSAVITFGEGVLTGPSAYAEDGFTFSSPITDLALMAIFDHVSDEVTEFNEIYMHAFVLLEIEFTMMDADGDLFTMTSFELDEIDSGPVLTISSSKGSFTLTSSDGAGVYTAGVDFSAAIFTDVSSVTFTWTAGLFDDGEVAIDNITVTVPEPSSFALIGLAGLAAALRQRKLRAS